MKKTIALVYAEDNQKMGARLRGDLEAAGYTVVDTVPESDEALTVVVISKSDAIKKPLYTALDNHQHVIPVLPEKIALPSVISNLQALDFSDGYQQAALLNRVKELTAPDAPRPLVSLTPAKRKQNQANAMWLVGLIMVMFVVAILGVMAGVFIPPTDEFAGVETQVYLTRNYYIDEALPKSTEDALNLENDIYELAAPTIQPFLFATATGIAEYSESTWYPRSTADATNFPATLGAVSTVVQDRMAATVTALAEQAEENSDE